MRIKLLPPPSVKTHFLIRQQNYSINYSISPLAPVQLFSRECALLIVRQEDQTAVYIYFYFCNSRETARKPSKQKHYNCRNPNKHQTLITPITEH